MKRSNDIPIVAGILAVALSWFLFHAIIWMINGSAIDAGRLVGPDSYMRLVRVEELLNGTGWFNDVIARANAPYGDQLHWTRPFDVLLITIATPLAPFLGWKAAIYWAGALTAPFLQIVTALLFGWAVFPFMRTKLWFLPAIAVFLQPAAAAAGLTGRADHHALFLLVFVAQFGFLLRALHNRHDNESAMWLGVLIGFGLWLSVEFLLNFALLAGTLGVAWLYDPKGRLAQNRHFALSAFAVVLIAVVLEHGIAWPPAIFFDEISLPHLLLVGLLAAFWLIAGEFHKARVEFGLMGRLFVTAVGGLATLGVMFAVFPKFFHGPMVDIDPRIVPIWLNWVLEMKDILPKDRETLGKAIIYLGHAAIALPYLIWRIKREDSAAGRLIWFAILLATMVYGVVALFHIRFSSYAQIAFIFALAGFIDSTFLAAAPIKSDISRGLVRGSAIALIFVGPIITGKVISNAGFENFADPGKVKTASEVCELPKLADHLNDETLFPDSEVILAFMDLGPQILYYTRHQIIGAPYHRNGEGIMASHKMFSTKDTEKSRSLMAERGVGLILLCPNSAEKDFYTATNGKEALYGRLTENNLPDWIEPLPLPDELRNGFKLFRLRL